jgi:hypothetical protein
MRGCPNQVALPQETDAHGIHQGVPGVPRGEIHFAAEGRNSDAVAVVTYAAHNSGEEVSIPRGMIEWAKPEAIEQGDRSGAHGKDVPQNPTHAGGGALVRLDCRGMVM